MTVKGQMCRCGLPHVITLDKQAEQYAEELKAQNQHYAEVIAKLQAEYAELTAKFNDGKGRHIESCSVPGTFLRRLGSLWSCHCGQVWRLGRFGSYGGDYKAWEKVKAA
jgi:hypothetical protein